MEVGDWQQPFQPGLQPSGTAGALALGTVAVAARVVGGAGKAAAVAGIDMAAEGRRAAGGQAAQHLGLLGGHRVPCRVGRAMHAKDVADVEGGARQDLAHGSPPLLGWPGRDVRQQIEGADDGAEVLGADVGVAAGAADRRVPQEFLQHHEVDASLEQVGGEAMA